jgi:Domain of unknown function (DUF305)
LFDNHHEVPMEWQPRKFIRFRAAVLTLALGFGSAAMLSPSVASRSAPRQEPASGAPAPPEAEAAYLAASGAAMAKMMQEMAPKPTGDVDRDFVATMVPHHQGAIDMAVAILRYGRNEQIKRLAQEIIVTQQQEIAAMRLAVGEPPPPGIASPTQVKPALPPAYPPLLHGMRSPT